MSKKHALSAALLRTFHEVSDCENDQKKKAAEIQAVVNACETMLLVLGVPKKDIASTLAPTRSDATVVAVNAPPTTVPTAAPKAPPPVPAAKTWVASQSKQPYGMDAAFSVKLPRPESSETEKAYYARIGKEYKEKGDLQFVHEVDGKKNVYTISHGFFVHVVKVKDGYNKEYIGMGGVSCTDCKKIHRLMHYQKVDGRWSSATKQTTENWTKLINMPIASKCDGEEEADYDDDDDDEDEDDE